MSLNFMEIKIKFWEKLQEKNIITSLKMKRKSGKPMKEIHTKTWHKKKRIGPKNIKEKKLPRSNIHRI